MAIQIISTASASSNHGVKALVYGRSGAGKTRLASTAPAPIIISAEKGLLSLRKFNLPAIEVESVFHLNEIYLWLANSVEARQFQTAYLDSITEIAEKVLANSKSTVKDPRQAYGELADKTIETIKLYRDLPGKHVVMTAKMEKVKDEATGMILNGPSMPGKQLGPALPYLFDEVFHLGVGKTPQGEEYRFLQTAVDLQNDAKDRSGTLDRIERPDLSFVFNKILSGV